MFLYYQVTKKITKCNYSLKKSRISKHVSYCNGLKDIDSVKTICIVGIYELNPSIFTSGEILNFLLLLYIILSNDWKLPFKRKFIGILDLGTGVYESPVMQNLKFILQNITVGN